MKVFFSALLALGFPLVGQGGALPGAPTDPNHPGGKTYSHEFQEKNLTCSGRAINLFVPRLLNGERNVPVVVYGHGQSLGLSAYKATFAHLAKKGIAVVFPAYDTGFFDQDWQRMGTDYVNLADCAISQTSEIDSHRVVYAGHSKGAYIAQIASGLAPRIGAKAPPRTILLFEPAGADASTLSTIDPRTALTVVFADKDTIVSRNFSEQIYADAKSVRRQLILVKSYLSTTPQLNADHFWPVTEKGMFGGGPEGPLHYYGSWKWLVSAAFDSSDDTRFDDPFLYGEKALEKGASGLIDDVKRNWDN